MNMNSPVKQGPDGVIEPLRERGAKTQEKLVAAALTLLKTQSFEAIRVADITARAGVATGSFYRRFKTKEAMLPLLYEAYDEIFNDWSRSLIEDERLSNRNVSVRLRALFENALSFFENNKGLMRALHLNSRLNASIAPEQSWRERQAHYHGVEKLIGDEIRDNKKRLAAAQKISFAMVSTLTELCLYPEFTPTKASGLDREALIELLQQISGAIIEGSKRTA